MHTQLRGLKVSVTKSIAVKILGKEYQISCPEDQTHHLIDAALLLDGRMKEIRSSGRVIGSERIAVMAALNLAHELLSLKSNAQQNLNDTEKRLGIMYEKIEEALAI